jgi:hypothetical protein
MDVIPEPTSTEPLRGPLRALDVLDSEGRKSTRLFLYHAGMFLRQLLLWPPVVSGPLVEYFGQRCTPQSLGPSFHHEHNTNSFNVQAS